MTSAGKTDILFVSHLHSDHISGIERMQAVAPAATVVVPYLDVIQRLILVLEDVYSGSISLSAYKYFEDPVSWWRDRRAEQIIFLEADDGGAPEHFMEPDDPIGGEDDGAERGRVVGRPARQEPGVRFAYHLRKPTREPPLELIAAEEGKRELVGGAVLAAVGSSLRLEWRPNDSTGWLACDWILLPYVHPIHKTSLARFRRAVQKTLKIKGNDNTQLVAELLKYLTSHEKTKILVALYWKYIGLAQNALSMSLYSGPSNRHARAVDSTFRWNGYAQNFAGFSPYYSDSTGVIGWLGTGDSALKQKLRRGPWLSFYGRVSTNVGVLTLPHHGSAHNFHNELLEFKGLTTALATTIESRDRVAGIRDTLSAVEARGLWGIVVDDHRASTHRVWCSRVIEK